MAQEEQKSLIYSIVARRNDAPRNRPSIVAEYENFKGNYTEIAIDLIGDVSSPNFLNRNNIFTCTFGALTFTYLVQEPYVYGVVAIEGAGIQLSIDFLQNIKEDFSNEYIGNPDLRQFGSKLKQHMQQSVNRIEEIKSREKVRARDLEVSDFPMMENIRRALGGKKNFQIHRRRMQFGKIRTTLIYVGVISTSLSIVVGAWWSGWRG